MSSSNTCQVNDQVVKTQLQNFQVHPFSGECDIWCQMEGSDKTVDFNLIYQRHLFREASLSVISVDHDKHTIPVKNGEILYIFNAGPYPCSAEVHIDQQFSESSKLYCLDRHDSVSIECTPNIVVHLDTMVEITAHLTTKILVSRLLPMTAN